MEFINRFLAQLKEGFSTKEGTTFLLIFVGLILSLIYFLKIRLWKAKRVRRRRRGFTRYRRRRRRR